MIVFTFCNQLFIHNFTIGVNFYHSLSKQKNELNFKKLLRIGNSDITEQ